MATEGAFCRVLVPSGALGLGFDRKALARGVARRPDVIAIDGGSTDSGPHYLGSGTGKYARAAVRAEWAELLAARAEAGCPLLIGTAGTSGVDAMVDELYEVTAAIAAERGERIRVARLYTQQAPDRVLSALAAGRIRPLPPLGPLSAETVRATTNIVALAGAEAIQAALATGADVVIAGRTTDTATIAALPLARGCHAGAAWHGAKVGECGALATTMPGTGVILLEFDAAGVTIEPMAEGARATPRTVAAHLLYENADPFILKEPGGHLDARAARYVALDERRVRIEGSEWVAEPEYTLKLEGAGPVGFQTVILALLRDRRYVENAARWADRLGDRLRAAVAERLGLGPGDWRFEIRLVGRDAVLGPFERRASDPAEVGALGIVTAPTAALADEIAVMANPMFLHLALTEEEEMPTFAFPFSPPHMSRGQVYAFHLNHVMVVGSPMEAFRLHVEEVGPC